jgi:hypothetical protein
MVAQRRRQRKAAHIDPSTTLIEGILICVGERLRPLR